MITILYIILVCYLPIIDGFIPVTSFGHGIPDLDGQRILFFFIFFAFFLTNAIQWNIKLSFVWLNITIVFGIIVLASVFWSGTPYVLRAVREVLFSVFMPIFVAFIGLNLFNDREKVSIFIKNLVVCAFLLSLISIGKMVVTGGSGEHGFRSSGFGALSNPNALATFLVLTLPCIIYAIEKEIFKNFVTITTFCTVVVGILGTISRKGLATMLLCVSLYLFLKKKYLILLILGLIIVIIGGMFAGASMYSDRLKSEELDTEFRQRGELVATGLRMFKENPFIGLGWEGYYHNYSMYSDGSRDREKFDAHNIYVTALADYGLLGFVPFMAIFLYPVLISSSILRSGPTKYEEYCKDIAVICICSILPFMISGYFSGGMVYRSSRMFLLYSIIAFLFSSLNKDDSIDHY